MKSMTEYSAGGIVLNRGRILLVFQKSTLTWAFPKGHIEGSESELEAARREIFEETQVSKLSLIRRLGSYIRPSKKSTAVKKHITMFLFETEEDRIAPQGSDVSECVWKSIEEVRDLISYKWDLEFFEAILTDLEH
jgi:8-oxo-dGTP pyrophosphatase MutT (NUDIX family)